MIKMINGVRISFLHGKADTRSNKYDKLLGYKSPETLTALPRELWNSTSDLIVLYPSGEKTHLQVIS